MGWKNRRIFVVKDGDHEVQRFDPIPLTRVYHDTIEKYGGWEAWKQSWRAWTGTDEMGNKLYESSQPNSGAISASEVHILSVCRDIFKSQGVKTFAEDPENGWMDWEFFKAFEQFAEFMETSKKNSVNSQSPLPSDTPTAAS